MMTFKITDYFDPYGDGKSVKKKYSSKYFHSETLSEEQVKNRIHNYNDRMDYYGKVDVKFSNYKIIGKLFDRSYIK
jgi:hypothetical protein